MNIEQYLQKGLEKGIIDYRIRVSIGADDKPQFYIHPLGKDGETMDIIAYSNRLYPVGKKPEGEPMTCACGCGMKPCLESIQS